VSLLAVGDAAGAARELAEALRLRANYVRARSKLGEALANQNRVAEALAAGRSAVQLDPNSAEGWESLGHLHARAEDWVGAREAFDRLLALKPDHALAFAFAFRMRELICDWRTRDADLQRLNAELDGALAAGEVPAVTPFHTLSIPCSAARQLAVAAAHPEPLDRSLGETRRSLALTHPRERPARLRIGYLSADFHCHATAQLMLALFGLHDRAGFEAFAYSYGPDDGSEYRRRIARDCDHFIDVAPLTHVEAARRIHSDGIHILVELKGATGLSRQEIPALRPAPIQAHYIGYPGTIGAGWIDHFIGDPVASPPELPAGAFREKLVILPHCYQVNDHRQPIAPKAFTRAECGLPPEGFVFCSFNNSYKLEPRMFGTWMRILAAVPGSVLWLLARHPEVAANLRREAAARGIDPNRLVFAAPEEKSLHLARHRIAGLFLDNLECNAHTTASDSLWAGVPLLACPGGTFASRVAASLLTAVGLPELIVPDLDSYERLAIRLATQPGELGRLWARLESHRATAPLFDTPRSARRLERAYRAMWQRYEAGQPPDLIVIDP
jgi:predicted O-linked N-acetylglucosamine transferase (SPINDLY family)